MPKFDSKAESQVFEHITGDYPFEIAAVDQGISTGAKTRGSETREVKLKFYTDATFTKPIAQWTEDFINSENCIWKWSVFAKCVGITLNDGEEFDITESWIGRRGWASCKPQASQTDTTKKYNRVVAFLTNKGALTASKPAPAPAAVEDDIPF